MKFNPDRLYGLEAYNFKPVVDAAEWAEKHRYMSQTHGMFSFSQTPFLRLPTQCISDIAGTCRVVLKTPAQVGKTTMIENMLGWICEYDRANTLLILDSLKTGQRMSKNRLRPFLREVCGINGDKDTNKDKSKEVCNIGLESGANLVIGSASSASDLCSTPAKFLCADELDRWIDVLDKEGDPLSLAFQRQMRFRGMALLTSTPTIEDGRINVHFKLGTQETWCAVCSCGHLMECRYDEIDFSGDVPIVACPSCGEVYTQKQVERLEHRFSQPKNAHPYKDGYGRVCRSFEVFSPLCHAFYRWEMLREEERTARAQGEEAVRSFRNTRLGEVYVPPDEIIIRVPDLMAGMAHYSLASIPSQIWRITVGIDTQDDGLALEVVGFGSDRVKYGLGWHWIGGDTSTAQPWADLRAFLGRSYRTSDGRTLPISLACIDSGGHRTQEVYAFCARNKRIVPIKGFTSKTSQQDPFIRGMSMANISAIGLGTGRVGLYSIGSITGKDYLLRDLTETVSGNRVCVWTDDDAAAYTPTYFDELTAERKIETRNGARWELMPGRRNEALDCRVYAMAAFEILAGRKLETASLLRVDPGPAAPNPVPKPDHSGSKVSAPQPTPKPVSKPKTEPKPVSKPKAFKRSL